MHTQIQILVNAIPCHNGYQEIQRQVCLFCEVDD